MCAVKIALIVICSVLTLMNAYLIVKLKYMKRDLKDQQDINRLLNDEMDKESGRTAR